MSSFKVLEVNHLKVPVGDCKPRDALVQALQEYRKILSYVDRDNVKALSVEIDMCRELVELLPNRIDKMRN